jgi:nucleoid-associated protein
MPVLHSVIHKIDKKPDGLPAVLFLDNAEQVESQARDDLMSQLNESYNANADTCSGRRLSSMKPVAR